MLVVDVFKDYSAVIDHLSMAKRCYAIIKQPYTPHVFLVNVEGTDGLCEDDVEYKVILELHESIQGNQQRKKIL